MSNDRKKRNNVLWVIIEVILMLAGFVCDYFWNYEAPRICEVSECVFGLLPIFLGFSITCYLLFVELYKDRYPYKFIKEKTLPTIRLDLIGISICIICGLLVIYHNNGLGEAIGFSLASFLACTIAAKDLFGVSRTVTIEAYVDDICSEMSEGLKKCKNTIEKSTFEDLNRVIDECVMKEEYATVRQISVRLGDVFRSFLKNSIALFDSGEAPQNIEESFQRIVKIGVRQVRMCNGISSDLVIGDIIRQQRKDIEFCIETNQRKWFDAYIEELTKICKSSMERKDEKTPRIVFEIFDSILKKTIKMENSEYGRVLAEKVSGISTLVINQSFTEYLDLYLRFLVLGLTKNKEATLDEFLFVELKEYTHFVNYYSNPGIEFTRGYYYCFEKLIKEEETKLNRFVQILFDEKQNSAKDSIWVELKAYCIFRLMEEKKECKEFEQYQREVLFQIIDLKTSYKGIVTLPKYKEMIYANPDAQEEIRKISNNVESIFDRSIISDNPLFFDYLLDIWSECLLGSDKRLKDTQIILFDVYLSLIEKAGLLDKKQFVNRAFDSMSRVITELDNRSLISESFGDYIIQRIVNVATDSYGVGAVPLWSINLLWDLVNERKTVYRFTSDQKKKKSIGRGIYNIAVFCIENDQEEGVRTASNALGWFIVKSIKKGYQQLVYYLIDLSGQMFNLAKNMQVSQKTQTFLTTLFTTVGIYCMKPEYKRYQDKILEKMKKIEVIEIKTAIDLRTYENDMFTDLYEGKTKEYSSGFLKLCSEKLHA